MELKRIAYGVIMAASLILVRFIDIYIYDMHTVVSVIFLMAVMVISYKLVDRSSFFDRQIKRNTYYAMNMLIVTILIIVFYAIES